MLQHYRRFNEAIPGWHCGKSGSNQLKDGVWAQLPLIPAPHDCVSILHGMHTTSLLARTASTATRQADGHLYMKTTDRPFSRPAESIPEHFSMQDTYMPHLQSR